MKGYWWECDNCKGTFDFNESCGSAGIAHYIWDILVDSGWDQANLLLDCPSCNSRSLRITYEFPRANKVSLRVIHIVGLASKDDPYLPMMWETHVEHYGGEKCFDFKYVNNRKPFGLNRPAVFTRSELIQLFKLYCEKTGTKQFP